jgi:hypothetical protein
MKSRLGGLDARLLCTRTRKVCEDWIRSDNPRLSAVRNRLVNNSPLRQYDSAPPPGLDTDPRQAWMHAMRPPITIGGSAPSIKEETPGFHRSASLHAHIKPGVSSSDETTLVETPQAVGVYGEEQVSKMIT